MPTRKMIPNPTDRLTISLDAADRAELEKLSRETDRSLAWIVRDALRQYLAKAREKNKDKAN